MEHHKIMDYSLLVGIFDAEKSSDNTIFDHIKSEKRIGKFSSMRSEDGKEEYKTGVIDILQLWNFQKKAASTYKSISNEKVKNFLKFLNLEIARIEYSSPKRICRALPDFHFQSYKLNLL